MMQHVFLAATLVVAGSFQTAYGQCTTPGSLAAAPDGSGNMILSWSDTGADSYTLNLEDAPGNPEVLDITYTGITGTSFTSEILTPGFSYKFKVRSHCGGDHSSWSSFYIFTADGDSVVIGGDDDSTGVGGDDGGIGGGVDDSTGVGGDDGGIGGGVDDSTGVGGDDSSGVFLCDAPDGLMADAAATSATLSWNMVDGAFMYRIKVEDGSGNPVDFLTHGTTGSTSFDVSGLEPSSNYKFKVRTLCVGDHSGWSSWKPFTTAPLRMAAPVMESIYPNPAADQVNLVLLPAEVNAQLQVIDMTGRIMFAEVIPANTTSFQIPTAGWPEGMYRILLQNNESKPLMIAR